MIPTVNLTKTGQNIKALRKQKGITVAEIQNAFGFNNPTAIYKWERGECLPSIDNLVILAYVLQVSMEDILRFN